MARLANRYDKLAVVYRAAAVLSTIVAWLAALGGHVLDRRCASG